MGDETKWLIGLELTMFVAVTGVVITAFYNLASRIREGDDALRTLIKNNDDALHERVNRVRDDYVRRTDLDGHLQRVDASLRDMRDEMRSSAGETNRRLDTLIAAVTKVPVI